MAMVPTVLHGGIYTDNQHPPQQNQTPELTWAVGPFASVLEGPTSHTRPQPFQHHEGMVLELPWSSSEGWGEEEKCGESA